MTWIPPTGFEEQVHRYETRRFLEFSNHLSERGRRIDNDYSTRNIFHSGPHLHALAEARLEGMGQLAMGLAADCIGVLDRLSLLSKVSGAWVIDKISTVVDRMAVSGERFIDEQRSQWRLPPAENRWFREAAAAVGSKARLQIETAIGEAALRASAAGHSAGSEVPARPGEGRNSEPPRTNARSNPCRFFVSYTSIDRASAEWIAWQVEKEYGEGWVVLQAWDFLHGGNFVLDMQRASEDCERTIALLSPDYLTSAFAQPEWAEAFRRDPTGADGLLVPVRIRECQPAGLLGARTYIDLVGLDEVAARDKLLAGLRRGRNKPLSEPPFPGHIHSKPMPPFPGLAAEGGRSDVVVDGQRFVWETPELDLHDIRRLTGPFLLTGSLREAVLRRLRVAQKGFTARFETRGSGTGDVVFATDDKVSWLREVCDGDDAGSRRTLVMVPVPDGSLFCLKCGKVLPSGANNCADCGIPASKDQRPGPQG